MRVLVVRLGAFGDIVHTLPLAADLVAAGHQVGWVAEDRWGCLLRDNPAIARVHAVPRKALRDRSRSLGERFALLRALAKDLRSGGYDVVIDAQGLAKSAAVAVASDAPIRLGHGRGRSREGAGLILHRAIASARVHVIDQQRDLGRLLGLTPTGPWRFPLPDWAEERAWADDWLGERMGRNVRSWILNVGAGWPTKVWPVARHGELLRLLQADNVPALVVWGSPAEEALARDAIAQAGHGLLAPPTTIPQLAGLIARGRVFISGDTGPLHLALALGTPAVGLFGPVPMERNGPSGRGYRCLQAPGAAWERKDLSKVDMGAISAAAVADAARGNLAEAHCALAEAHGAVADAECANAAKSFRIS